ncbi:MAG: AMP-binding protein [Gemmatimonadetes bacterium]|nr:AMP-binding protein [Gemmatimonadota bacterium]
MGPGERYRGLTVASCLANRATTDPEATFLLAGDQALSFGLVDARAEALAAALHNLGIEAGDRIAIVLPNRPEFVIAMFAAAKLGAAIVPLSPQYSAQELQYLLRHSEAAVAVAVEQADGIDFLDLFEGMMPRLPALQYLVTVGEEDLWYDDRIFQFEDLLSAGEGRDFPAVQVDPERDVFAILYTSGTMGKPKGVELTHTNLLAPACGTVEAISLGCGDRVIGVTMLSQVFGLGPGVLGTLLAGATLVLQEEVDAGATLDLIERHGVTVHYGVPTVFVTELQELRRRSRDASTLRVGIVAGAPVSDRMVAEVRQTLCPNLQIAYSLAETGSTVCVTRPDDPQEAQLFTVGRPLSGTEARILDADRRDLPVESVGEIAVRGPGVMKGYYRQPVETRRAFTDDGFFLTGDLGIVDEGGFLHVVGRRKEIIIRGGYNVYPREVEGRIQAHPAVREAVAVGVPDRILGEAICACIVPVEGAIVTGTEIQEWCRATLADYKVPDLVRFLETLPMTGAGKVRRLELVRMIYMEDASRRE